MIRPMTPPTASLPKQNSACEKVRLLLWKNYLLQKRHKLHTLIDVFLPVCFFIFCAWLQKHTGGSLVPKVTYPPLPINSLEPLWHTYDPLYPPIKEHSLVFSPNDAIFSEIMKRVSEKLQLQPAIGVADGRQLEKTIVEKGLIAGVEFHHSNVTNRLSYSLRFPAELRKSLMNPDIYNWQTNLQFPYDAFPPRYPQEEDGGPPSYQKEGFLVIQNAIAQAFFETKSTGTPSPDIMVQRFPYPSFIMNLFTSDLQILMPLFFLMSLNYTFLNTVRYIAIEKEKQLKEAMKIMGLASWMHYLSWFLRTIIMLIISITLIVLLLTRPWFGAATAIFPKSSFFCLMVFFVGYCICLITFGFVICAIFSASKTAMTGATVAWYLTSAPFFLFSSNYERMSGWLKVLFCFCPNSAVSFGFKIIARLEAMGEGLTWRTAFRTTSVYDNLSIAVIFGIFILNAIILFFITLYLENVMPGGYGVSKPWYFIFTTEFWRDARQYNRFEDSEIESYEFPRSNSNKMNFESEPMNKPIGMEIRNLTKKFTKDKAAVNGLCLNIYDNQITCLLGHNGAGKTTAISMLTGMMEPTAGTALINGYDIRTNMDIARSSMGFCPQHNILFDELTVREHIIFYSRLKGLSAEAADGEVRKYVQLLELQGKVDEVSSSLSGGMKRKLSVVIALCGQSKVVFLDEPTSGMDPGARRALWDILLAEKRDRTILLTTHFMDEADVLSDRIAIMDDGELKCAGSTFFLKKRFGTGYHLVCAKDNYCDSEAVTELLQTHLPELRVESDNDTELSYLLPEDKVDLFKGIFEDLENNQSELNLKGFGVSLTTLEEIFLKIGKSVKTDEAQDEDSVTQITLNDDHMLLQGVALYKNQAMAMFRKRYLCTLRAWMSFLYHNLFAAVVIALTIFQVGDLFSKSSQLPALDIDFAKYKSPVSIMPTKNSSIASEYASIVKESVAQLLAVDDSNGMEAALLGLAQTALKEFKFQYLTAISFLRNGTIVAWFNNQAIHSAPLALSLVHNAILKTLSDDFSIHVTNAPLKFLPKNDTTPDILDDIDGFGFFFAMTTSIVLSVLLATYISFYIKEKECNAKFMQYASGVNVFVFWAASIAWDLLTNTITVLIIIFMLILGQRDQWNSPKDLAIVFLILELYNFAMMPLICIFSLIFTKPTTGMNVVSIFSLIIVIAFLLNQMLSFMHKIVSAIFWMYPLCTMTDALIKLPKLNTIERNCQSACGQTNCNWDDFCQAEPICCPGSIFSWDNGIGRNMVLFLVTGIGSYVILVMIELGALNIIKRLLVSYWPKSYPHENPETMDSDVNEEKVRIGHMSVSELKTETMVMQNVSKFYGQFCAVNQVSLSIKRAECFGLLGKNGAGKSSIFKMLTGETMISSGEIFTQGFNQKTQMQDIYKIIGYCPQFDALLGNMTCRETLEIFAMVRGVPVQDVKYYTENGAKSLDFIQHIDKKIKQLSGGNKRKLSTCLAIIGNLSVIFLDEPTTGMDPATKRNLWNVVIKSREAGKSIVLTSHSMEECEALCTRMTVLVNGECKCLGSSQHLKNKFTKGFELKIKVKLDYEAYNANIINVKNFVLQTFNGAIFREEYQGILTYSVPVEYVKWSALFDIMENAKKTLSIEDYSVSQSTLEQVVLTLVKDQHSRQNFEAAP